MDLTGNGFPDIITSNYDTPMRVYINSGADLNSDGGMEFSFEDERLGSEISNVQGIEIFDANGDSLQDLFLAKRWGYGVGGMENMVLVQQPGGTFIENPSAVPLYLDRSNSVVSIDLNGDDLNDLIVANGSYYAGDIRKDRSYVLINSGRKNADSLWVFFNPLDSVSLSDSVWSDSMCTQQAIVADCDDNGYLDILFINRMEACKLFMNRCSSPGNIPRFEEAEPSALPDTLLRNYDYYCGDHADVDLDGDQDILVSTYDNKPMLFNNDGTGHFIQNPFPTFPHWGFRRKVIFEDFNGDLLPDVIIADQIVRYFQNNPDDIGSFIDCSNTHFPNNNMENQITVYTMTTLDADMDGDPDVFTGNAWEQNRLYSNNRHGEFSNVTFSGYPADASDDYQVYPYDIDGDDDLDIFYGGRDDSLHFYENLGGIFVKASHRIVNQGWATAGSGDTEVRVRSWAFADLSNDGLVDFVLGGSDPENLVINNHIHVNRGDGTYADSTRLNIPWLIDIAAKDIFLLNANGDDRPDIFIAGVEANRKDALYLNHGDTDGDGVDNFVNIPGAIPNSCIGISGYSDFADINGDSLDDIIIAKVDSFVLDFTLGWRNILLLSNGDSTYFDATDSLFPESAIRNAITMAARFGDVNGDGYQDILFVNGFATDDPPADSSAQSALLIFDPATGLFIDATDSLPGDAWMNKPDGRFADIDNDGDLDIIVGAVWVHLSYGRFNRHPLVYINNGHGRFEDATDEWIPGIGSLMEHHNAINVGDLDSDGYVDFVSQCDGQSRIWWNHYSGTGPIVEQKTSSPGKYEMIKVYPNPFNSACRITTPAGSQIKIYDLTGREVEGFFPTIHSSIHPLIQSEFLWRPGHNVSSGIYFIKANLGEQSVTKRLVYLK
ncbi:T9SS type A sorting domain-containing protein [bacterium]|nr:T9SS type A sorting domain-containing protein [bacterium]